MFVSKFAVSRLWSLHQPQIDTACVQFGEKTIDGSNLGFEMHPYRNCDSARQQRGIPDRTPLSPFHFLVIRIVVAQIPRYSTTDRSALELLAVPR